MDTQGPLYIFQGVSHYWICPESTFSLICLIQKVFPKPECHFRAAFPPRMPRAHKLRVSWKEISAVEDNISWCTEGFATSLLCGCERDATLLFLSEVRLTLIILCRRWWISVILVKHLFFKLNCVTYSQPKWQTGKYGKKKMRCINIGNCDIGWFT